MIASLAGTLDEKSPERLVVDVGGVGFWNPSTATRGSLKNGAELRPLTNFKIVSGCGVP